jgi:hypothetical protein
MLQESLLPTESNLLIVKTTPKTENEMVLTTTSLQKRKTYDVQLSSIF